MGFPGSSVAKKETASQCRRHGFNSWSGKIPHPAKELSPSAPTIAYALWSPGADTSEFTRCDHWTRSALEATPTGEPTAMRSPRTAPRGQPLRQKTQHSQTQNILCCYVTWVVSDSVRPHRQQPTRIPRPWDSPGKNTGVGCHFLLQCMKVKSESEVAQSCPTRSNPLDCSPPGSSAQGTLQVRVLERKR